MAKTWQHLLTAILELMLELNTKSTMIPNFVLFLTNFCPKYKHVETLQVSAGFKHMPVVKICREKKTVIQTLSQKKRFPDAAVRG